MIGTAHAYPATPGFTDEFHRVRDFLVRINQGAPATPGFLWGRWEWMFSLPYLDTSSLPRIGIWERDGQIVAVATYETDLGSAYLLTDPEHADLLPDVFQYALAHLARDGAIKVLVDETDRALQRIAAASGLTATSDNEANAVLDLTGDLSYRLPKGYRIASIADECDLLRFDRLLHRGFSNPGLPRGTAEAVLERRTSLSGPHVDPNLNMVVVAPDGEYAAYCGIWHELGTSYALVEPVCTDPDHRRRGLGRAVVLEAARRCRDRGAGVAFVGSDQPFYYAIGFTPHSKGTWWSNHQLRNSPPAIDRDGDSLSNIYAGERSHD